MSDETFTAGAQPKSPFTKAVKNIRSLIKKGDVHIQRRERIRTRKVQINKKKVPSREVREFREPEPRAIIYLSHLPHGFEETGIRGYLEQFGKVKFVKLIRSLKTGRSRGFGFVEFFDQDVANIVVETMNNYLMFNRLIKAEHVKTPTEGRNMLQMSDSAPFNPEDTDIARNRNLFIKKRNRVLSKKEEQRAESRSKRSVARLEKKLQAQGISFKMEATETSWVPVIDKEESKESTE